MGAINYKLLPLKILLCLLYAAFGCIAPFLTIHMFRIGLLHDEVTWINTILPLTSLIGPPIAGYLCDKFGHYRVITISSMLLAGLFYSSLLFVPERPLPPQELQQAVFQCSQGDVSLLHEPVNGCTQYVTDEHIHYRISNCRTECSEKSCQHLLVGSNVKKSRCSIPKPSSQPLTSNDTFLLFEGTTPQLPEICFRSDWCETFDENKSVNIISHLSPASHMNNCCEYNLFNLSSPIGNGSEITCPYVDPGCYVLCDVKFQKNESIVVEQGYSSSGKFVNDETFWLYFFLRIFADMFPAILVSLLDAVALTMTSQHGGDFGRQKLLGLMAIGISAPVVGVLTDVNTASQGVQKSLNFLPVFFVFDVLMILTAIITIFLPFNVEINRSGFFKNLGKLLTSMEFITLFSVVVSLGMMWGYLETFLYPYLQSELCASNLLIGLTVTVGILPSIPFLYKSEEVVKICGHHYLLMLAFIMYCIRYVGMSHMSNPYWVLPMEALELFTLNLAQVAAATLAFKLAPKSLCVTAQSLIWMAHFDIGRCIGTFIGGNLMKTLHTTTVFDICAVFCAVFAAVYLILHYIFRKNKKRTDQTEQTAQEKPNGNIPNGTGQYVPLAANPLEED